MSIRDYAAIGVVGATGVVGRTMIEVLSAQGARPEQLRLFASKRSAGETIDVDGVDVPVHEATPESLAGLDVALFSAGGATSAKLGPVVRDLGAVVIDNSSTFRMDPTVPLVVPEVNPDHAFAHQGIIANPNCSTIQAVVALAPIARAFGLRRVAYTSYQAVSGAGQAALLELAGAAPTVFPTQIAGNVIPQIGEFDAEGFTGEEVKMVQETCKILGLPELRVKATCVRVPVHSGHCVAINLEAERPLSVDAVREVLASAPGVRLAASDATVDLVTPLDVVGRDDVTVGRIRLDESAENGLHLWVAADNLRKGAATNAVQIAELLKERA